MIARSRGRLAVTLRRYGENQESPAHSQIVPMAILFSAALTVQWSAMVAAQGQALARNAGGACSLASSVADGRAVEMPSKLRSCSRSLVTTTIS